MGLEPIPEGTKGWIIFLEINKYYLLFITTHVYNPYLSKCRNYRLSWSFAPVFLLKCTPSHFMLCTLRRVISEIALGSFSGLSQIQVGSSVRQAWLLSAVAVPCCFFSLLTLFLGFALRHHTWVLEFFVRWKCDVKVLIFRPHSSCPWDALQTACTHCTLSPCGSLSERCSPIVLDVLTLGPWLMSLFGKV